MPHYHITIKLKVPTRDGDTELHILSNVPSGRASASQLARVYGKRWSIETAFFEITTTLTCEINTLLIPRSERPIRTETMSRPLSCLHKDDHVERAGH